MVPTSPCLGGPRSGTRSKGQVVCLNTEEQLFFRRLGDALHLPSLNPQILEDHHALPVPGRLVPPSPAHEVSPSCSPQTEQHSLGEDTCQGPSDLAPQRRMLSLGRTGSSVGEVRGGGPPRNEATPLKGVQNYIKWGTVDRTEKALL